MRFHAGFLEPQHESDRFLICRLRFPARPDILLAMAHLPSKAHGEEEGRLYECQLLSQAVKEVEAKVGHTRTVLVGDLNVNPFEKSVVGTLGLHAVMAKDVAKRNTRKVQDREYQFFYNPMWSHFGERAKGPPGTYYYGAGGHINYFWNIFDQVLLRPDLIEKFPEDELQILTSIGDVDLLGASGKPDQRIASDHLPIFFKLDI
jgi:endonuclease/exonuclease/phosphatase family metal-dependent hydrolase